MKQLIILLSCLLGVNAAAQNTNSLSDIKAPSSPSAVIIGTQPSTIARPKSWQALEAAIYSNYFNNNNFIVPDDYSLEFTPYWSAVSRLSNEDFLVPSVGLSALQNLSFSASSTKSFAVNDSLKSDALGFGVRTMLWQGTKKEKEAILFAYRGLITSLDLSGELFKIAENIACAAGCTKKQFLTLFFTEIKNKKSALFGSVPTDFQDAWIKRYQEFLEKELPEGDYSVDATRDAISDLTDDLIKISTSLDAIEKLRGNRKGFKLELAGAMALSFPTNRVDYSFAPRFGIWATPSFEPYELDWIEALGVLRYYWYNDAYSKLYLPGKPYFENNFDYGLKLVFKWKKTSFGFEGTGRSSSVVLSKVTDTDGNTVKTTRSKGDTQYIGSFNYQIRENLVISYSFGKQFKPVIGINENLISMLSLNFGLGAPKATDIQQ